MEAYNPAWVLSPAAEKYGNTYIDAFINMKWQRATIFVKYTNATGLPDSGYFLLLIIYVHNVRSR